ncbi:ribonuclease H-like domain-containing protein, partial [Tanacetum coccineum]
MSGSDDENPPQAPPPQTPTQQAPHTVSTIKLPILKKDTNGVIKVLPPKTAEEILARERERKARTTLLMALPEDHLAKFHKMTDAKEMWDAIKSRFFGNDKSKKMQKYIIKQQFEGFYVSNSEGLHKGYDRFQSLLSQFEIHGAGVSTEDANQKVCESNVKGSTRSSSIAHNVSFVSSKSTSSTNDVSTAYGVSTSSGYNPQREYSSSYTDELMYSFFANQSSGPQLDHEDLEQLDEFDLEEMDLKWQVAMISMILKKFYKKTGRRLQFDAKELVGFDKTKTGHAEDEQENFALMAYSNSGSDTEDNPQRALKNKGIVDSGCFRHMTGNKAYLVEYQDYNGGPVAFRGSKGYITGKGKIKTGKLDFEDVCFVKELQHFNLFFVSQMCDKKNKVLFTETECLVLSSDFKLPDENQVLLRIPRQNNMYSFNLENIVLAGGLACLIAKATVDESNKWHRRDIIEFCGSKGIKREYCNARTPQQNRVDERKNMTLIKAARTMLADSFLPNTFWAEAVSTACYVLNRVLVTKPQNKTPYELINDKIPIIIYIRPFGCHVTILNTIEHLGKFEGKFDEGILVRYSLNSMAFRPMRSANQANKTAGQEEANHSADKCSKAKNEGVHHTKDTGLKTNEEPVDQEDQAFLEELERLKRQENKANDASEVLRKKFSQSTEDLLLQAGAARATSTNTINTVSTPLSTANPSNVFSIGGPSNPNLTNYADQYDSQIPALEDIYGNLNDGIFTNASYDDKGAVTDFTNLESTVNVSPIPTLRIHSIHPIT